MLIIAIYNIYNIPMRKNDWKLSIVTPFYNEEEAIDLYFKTIKEELSRHNCDWEIIAVDDGSSDSTYKDLSSYHKQDTRIKVVKLSRNFGKEAALTAGLHYATGDAIVPLDSDLQDPPRLLKEMIAHWQDGYDVVIPVREYRSEPFIKRLTASLFYGILNRISDKSFSIKNAGDFRLLDRKVLEVIKQLNEYHRFMKGILSWSGFKCKYISYHRPPRAQGTTKYNYRGMLLYAMDGIFSFSIAPIRIITLLGIITSTIFFIYGGYLIYLKLIFDTAVAGYTSTIVAILCIGGMQLTAIGIIGEYIGRIYNEVKHRPIYVVDETLL